MNGKMQRGRVGELAGRVVAGLVLARCGCCREPEELVPHPELDGTRLTCPGTGQVHLDRGDGVFELEPGRRVSGDVRPAQARAEVIGDPDVLSDRPRRSDDKARISLERATFAGGARR